MPGLWSSAATVQPQPRRRRPRALVSSLRTARLVPAVLVGTAAAVVLGLAAPAGAVDAPVLGELPPSDDATPSFVFSAPTGATTQCSLVLVGQDDVYDSCTSPWGVDLGGRGEGTYRLAVVAEATGPDGVAERSAPATATWTLDVPPAVTPLSAPASPGADRSPTWTFSVTGATTVTCVLDTPTGAIGEECADGSYTADLSAATDGTYSLSVRAEDADPARTVLVPLGDYVLDAPPPAPTVALADGVRSPGSSPSPTWAFSVADGATAECTLSGPTGTTTDAACTSPYTATLAGDGTADGTWQLSVVATDASGSSPAASASYVLDTIAPTTAPTPTGPTGAGVDETPTWTFDTGGEPGAQCRLLPGGDWATCASPHTATLSADGTYSLEVRAVDAAGNTGPAGTSEPYAFDGSGPAAPTVALASGVTSPSSSATPGWTVTWAAGDSAECRVVGPSGALADWASCGATSPADVTASLGDAADGTYSLEARSVDAFGRTTAAAPSPYVLDRTPPGAPTSLAGPSGTGAVAAVSWSWSGGAARCELLLAGGGRGEVACTSPHAVTLPEDGSWQLAVRLVDGAGNVGAAATSDPYVLDRQPPAPPTVTGPTGPSSARTVTWSVTAEPGATLTCQLVADGAELGWSPCPAGPTLTLDGDDGSWVLQVTATDAAGSTSAAGSSPAYALDTAGPAAPVVTAPPSPGRATTPSWGVEAEAGAALQCRLLLGGTAVGDWAACAAPVSTPLSQDGTWRLEVRAVDVAGNTGAVGSAQYVLDTAAPAAPVVTPPASPAQGRTPVFSFTAESGSTATCQLSGGGGSFPAVTPCTSPVSLDLTGLRDGSYVLTVSVVDAAGNSSTAGSGTYVLDTTAPDPPVFTTTHPTPESDRSPSWTWSAEAGAKATCSFTGPGTSTSGACTSPYVAALAGLADGTYTLAVLVTDPAGNASSPATTTYELDSTAPDPADVVPPASPSNVTSPVWQIGAVGEVSCRLTRGTTVVVPLSACGSTFTAGLGGQPDGTYVLLVRVRDAAGNTTDTTSSYVLDTTAPASAVVTAPTSPSNNRSPVFTLSGAEAGATVACRVVGPPGVLQDWTACSTSVAVPLAGLPDGSYAVEARVVDRAGNVAPITSASYLLDSTAPTAPLVTVEVAASASPTPAWVIAGIEGATLQCRLSTGDRVLRAFSACEAGRFTADLTGQPAGTYVLTVRAVDAAGNIGPEVSSAYLFDDVPPAAPDEVVGPDSPGRERAPVFAFAVDAGSTALCVVTWPDGTTTESACASPFVLQTRGDGDYLLAVYALDAAGNRSVGAGETSYVLDTTAPEAAVVDTLPPASSNPQPSWGVAVEEQDAVAECRLRRDSGALVVDWAPCGEAFSPLLPAEGAYLLEVRVRDAAGNTGPTVQRQYVFDRTAPREATVLTRPSETTSDARPTFVFSTDAGADVACRFRMEGGPEVAWGACERLQGPPSAQQLHRASLRAALEQALAWWSATGSLGQSGRWVFEVRATDASGNAFVTSFPFTLDLTAPSAPVMTAPGPAGRDPSPAWVWSVSADRGTSVQCRLLREGVALTGWQACRSGYAPDLSAREATYALEVRVVDLAGNTSSVARRSYEYDVTPPPAPVFRGGSASGPADADRVSWSFVLQPGATPLCTLSHEGTPLRGVDLSACGSGSVALPLGGRPDGAYALTVRFVDAAGNTGPASSRAFTRSTGRASGPGRVEPARPTAPPPFVPPPAVPAAEVPVPRGVVRRPGTVPDLGRPGVAPAPTRQPDRPPAAVPAVPQPPRRSTLELPQAGGPINGVAAPEALTAIVGETLRKPTLPLALLGVMLLFLLMQSRLDRRDPKLAAVDVAPEPDLDFGPPLRPAGVGARGGPR